MDKIITCAHKLLQEVVSSNDSTIDLTAGKGHDTLFLAKISQKVYSFDIQEEAIAYTKKLTEKYHNIIYICDNHVNLSKYVSEKIKGAILNLGYLPGGNKKITTTKENTLKAIKILLSLLMVGGRCVIVIYTGHEEGKKEAKVLNEYLPTLSQFNFEVVKYQFINQINNPPYLIVIERIKL